MRSIFNVRSPKRCCTRPKRSWTPAKPMPVSLAWTRSIDGYGSIKDSELREIVKDARALKAEI